MVTKAKVQKAHKVATIPAGNHKPAVITVNLKSLNKVNYRGARAAWATHLVAHNGKTVAAFAVSALANPPSVPKNGKLAGQCEPPAGWLAFFKAQGHCTIA